MAGEQAGCAFHRTYTRDVPQADGSKIKLGGRSHYTLGKARQRPYIRKRTVQPTAAPRAARNPIRFHRTRCTRYRPFRSRDRRHQNEFSTGLTSVHASFAVVRGRPACHL